MANGNVFNAIYFADKQNAGTYVEKKDESCIIDIVALNREIESIVSKENKLRTEIQKIIDSLE